jgi:hypothetical protein
LFTFALWAAFDWLDVVVEAMCAAVLVAVCFELEPPQPAKSTAETASAEIAP